MGFLFFGGPVRQLRALAQKVTDGSFSLSLARAKEIASWVFFENPKRIFGLERLLKGK
jgi:hypothetical protein